MHSQRDRFTDGELGAEEIDLVVWIDFIVVGWVAEGEWKHALFLQVCLVLNVQARGELMIFGDGGKQEQERRWLKGSWKRVEREEMTYYTCEAAGDDS